MEDSIALAQALVRRAGTSRPRSSTTSSSAGPLVERTQAAASESAAYFRRVASYTHLEPVQFAFNLLTRSGRITPREPRRSATRTSRARSTRGSAAREVVAAAAVRAARAARRALRRTASASRSSGFVAVSAEGRITPETPTIDEWTPPPVGLVALQLGHAGRRGACRPRSVGIDVPLRDGWPLVSAAPLPYGPFSAVPAALDEAGHGRGPRELRSRPRVRADELGVARARARPRARLPARAASSRRSTNPDGDRLRFPLEVVDAVRAVWPRVLAARLSVTDWHPRGNSVDDGIAIARALREHGCRPDPRRGRPDGPRRPPRVPPRLPHRAQRPRAKRGARADAGARPPDDARRGEHDRRRRPSRPVHPRPPSRRPRDRASGGA